MNIPDGSFAIGAILMGNLRFLRSATLAVPGRQPAWPTSSLRRTLLMGLGWPCQQWTPCTPAWATLQVLLHHTANDI